MGKISLILFYLLILTTPAFSDNDFTEIKRFRVRTTYGTIQTNFNGVLTSNNLNWISQNGDSVSIPVEHIEELYRYSGTMAKNGLEKGILIGFLTFAGLYTAAVIHKGTSSENYQFDNERVRIIGAGLTISGGIIGMVIGLFYEKWEEIPLRTGIGYSSSQNRAQIVFGLNF